VGRLKKTTGRRRLARRCRLRRAAAFLAPPIARRLVRWALAAAAALPTIAVAQEAPAPASDGPQTADQDLGGGPEGDVLNRVRLFQLEYAVKTAPGSGPDGTIRTVTTDTFKLRGDTTIDLNSDWQLALRADLPFVAKDPFNSSNPDADFLYGLGDADVQAALIHELNARWTAGFGARLIMPTGDDNLGSGKWQVMPIAGVRYALPEISLGSYVEPLMRYDQSFAGDPSRKAISNLQFAPMVNFSLPDLWFFTLYPSPDIRWNFGPAATGQTGRLFLPFDARIGRKFSKNLNVSLEVGVPIIRQYPVYDFTSQLRVNIIF
jgi:Putative MetA-pathway of phenol degradation